MITTPLHITDLASVFHRFVEPSVLSPKLRPKHAKMEQLENVNNNKVEEIRKIPKIEGPEPLNQLEIAKILANAVWFYLVYKKLIFLQSMFFWSKTTQLIKWSL
jgi:hypothetical protein